MDMFTALISVFAAIGIFATGVVIYLFFHVQGLRYTQECKCPKCGDRHWCAPDDDGKEIEIEEDELIA